MKIFVTFKNLLTWRNIVSALAKSKSRAMIGFKKNVHCTIKLNRFGLQKWLPMSHLRRWPSLYSGRLQSATIFANYWGDKLSS